MSHAATAKTLALVAGILNLVIYGLPMLGLLATSGWLFLLYFMRPDLFYFYLMTYATSIIGGVVGFVALVLRPIVLKTPLRAGVPWIVFGAIGLLTIGGMFLLSAGIVACVAAGTAPRLQRRLPERRLYPPQPEPPRYGAPEPVPLTRPSWLPEQPSESPPPIELERLGAKETGRVGKRRRAKCAECGGLLEPGDRYCMACGSEVT